MLTVAATLNVIGEILIAYTALAVHRRVRREHKINRTVFRAMGREQALGVTGIVFLILGYLSHIANF